MSNSFNSKRLLNELISLARQAGQAILSIYESRSPLDVQIKSDNSPVTQADLLAHQIIVEGLARLTPEIPILSEEDSNIPFEVRQSWNTFWLVDPLDGTREFISRSGQFTVNIALIEDHLPVLGIIYVPLKNELYYATKERGSWKVDALGLVTPLCVRQWQSGEVLVVTTRRELLTLLKQYFEPYGGINVIYRSSSLKFCLIAQGGADIYVRRQPIHEWDTAAGQCILEQAGGSVLNSDWGTLRYNTKANLINLPFIALGDEQQLLAILKKMSIFKEIENE